MKHRNLCLILLLLAIGTATFSQTDKSMTYNLVYDFHKAWNDEDLNKMESLMDKNAFFKSPFKLRYSRDTNDGNGTTKKSKSI